MRTYGRIYPRDASGGIIPNQDGSRPKGVWAVVQTDPAGFNDQVWLTTLAQVLQLNLNESPFFADWGIPQQPSVVQQVFPDFYIWLTQQRFSQYFASILITKEDSPTPTYRVNVTTSSGQRLTRQIAA